MRVNASTVYRATGIQAAVVGGLDPVIEYLAGVGYGLQLTEAEARGYGKALAILHQVRALRKGAE